MLKIVFVTISFASLLCLLYGVFFSLFLIEENSCKMTYMYEYPQFVRIHFDANKMYPQYGLYAYSEGYLTEKARSMQFSGAPVIFVPGNGGSYKQARSLATVAIRKGIDNHWDQHLDYFSIDYNEEYSALFGGYLDDQNVFLKLCIRSVLNLYQKTANPPQQVVLIGHSMGGKVAQSVLTDHSISKLINTVITISSPIDKPVINLDVYFDAFYRKVDALLVPNRTIAVNKPINNCRNRYLTSTNGSEEHKPLDDILMVTIGGGNRDIQVDAELTRSKYSDVHVLATAIPNVWVSTDHLCSVWCLQLVLTVNRFLYSIIAPSKSSYNYKSSQYFIEDKYTRLAKANHFFVKPYQSFRNKEVNLTPNPNNIGDWIEDSKRVYSRNYPPRFNNTVVEMIRLIDSPQYKMLYGEVVNVDTDDWFYGCAALEVQKTMRYCSKAIPLPQHVSKLPSIREKRRFVNVDLHKLKRANSSFTHVLIRLPPTKQSTSLNIDLYNPSARNISITMPKWYSFSENLALEDTAKGSSFYQVQVFGLHESYQSLGLKITPRSCTTAKFHVVAQVCVPWASGCEKYQYFTEEKNDILYVQSIATKPSGYNGTENPIIVNLHLDPNCRYIISYKSEFGATASNIVRQYFHWLPAHLTVIILLSLKHQISLTPNKSAFKCGTILSALFNSSPFFVITITRLLAKFVLGIEQMPEPDPFTQSILISALIHGSAMALLLMVSAILWVAIRIYGNVAHTILLKIIKLPLPTISSAVMSIIDMCPITAGVILSSIATASCGGIALICGLVVYFGLITKQYEDYLEEFVYKTAKEIAKKLFGEFSKQFLNKSKSDPEQNNESTETVKDNEDGQAANADYLEQDPKEDETNILDDEKPTSTDAVDNEGEDNGASIENIERVENDGYRPEEDAELNKLLHEVLMLQREKKAFSQMGGNTADKKEYDSVHEGISAVNFHMTMFLLFALLTVINLPSTIAWAKNFKNSATLLSDPSLLPALVVIFCSSLLWQFSTPRNVFSYQFVGCTLYVCGLICLLYCQDSVYRLNGVIPAVFLIVTVHQFCAPKRPDNETEEVSEEEQTKLQFAQIRSIIAGTQDASEMT